MNREEFFWIYEKFCRLTEAQQESVLRLIDKLAEEERMTRNRMICALETMSAEEFENRRDAIAAALRGANHI